MFKQLMENPRFMEFIQSSSIAHQVQGNFGMPGTVFRGMQGMVPTPMYANIGLQPGFRCTQGQFGVSQGNLGMAGFSIPSVNMTPAHQHVTGQEVQMAPTGVPIMQTVSFDNLELMDKPKPYKKDDQSVQFDTFSGFDERTKVRNWFTKKRYILKKQGVDFSGKKDKSCIEKKRKKAVPKPRAVSDEKNGVKLQFEAKSSRDSAWYDVKLFLAHRMIETGDPQTTLSLSVGTEVLKFLLLLISAGCKFQEIRVRFDGYDAADDEWVNMRTSIRERSLPCEASDCVYILPGDLTLCFKEGSEHALHFDALVLEVDRRRHDVRGCRCRFLVQYVCDGSKDVLPLRKVCRRPETNYRPQGIHSIRDAIIMRIKEEHDKVENLEQSVGPTS
ncbi:hypothetical protein L7F22_067123 [Adiantum nelumboides]|nr:hypothetical protein [Adiantum nelumboides]